MFKSVQNFKKTVNYDLFKFAETNRGINTSNLRKIKKSIAQNGQIDPISVTKDGYVIDGQHRLIACKELGREVMYAVRSYSKVNDEERFNREIMISNTDSKPWSNADRMNQQTKKGNENYKQLDSFMKKYKFSLTVALGLLGNGNASNKDLESYRSGNLKFEVTPKLNIRAKVVSNLHSAIKGAGFGVPKSVNTAVCALLSDFDHTLISEISNQIRKYPSKFKPMSTRDEQIRNFEDVYNYRKGKDNRRRFF